MILSEHMKILVKMQFPQILILKHPPQTLHFHYFTTQWSYLLGVAVPFSNNGATSGMRKQLDYYLNGIIIKQKKNHITSTGADLQAISALNKKRAWKDTKRAWKYF